MLVDHLLKAKKDYESLKKPKIGDIFNISNYIKPAFSIVWLAGILKIYLKEKLLIQYYVIKHLI